jgi:hypothetical protein
MSFSGRSWPKDRAESAIGIGSDSADNDSRVLTATTTGTPTPRGWPTPPASVAFTRSPPWTGWLIAVMAAAIFLYGIDILFHPTTPGVSEMFQKFASSALFFGAAILCMTKARASRGERWAWCLFAVAMALLGVASVYYVVVLWNLDVVPYPSIYDGLWLAFFPPAYAALYLLMRKRAVSLGRAAWLDALIGGLGVGGAAAALAFGVILENTSGTALATATNLAWGCWRWS